MNDANGLVRQSFRLSSLQAERLHRFAASHRTSEDVVVARALDILFSLAELLDDGGERQAWSGLSTETLATVWDNDADAAYDNWRELYGLSAG